MKVSRTNILTGKENTLEIDINSYQLYQINQGAPVQKIVPDLSREHREFLISGIFPEDQVELFADRR